MKFAENLLIQSMFQYVLSDNNINTHKTLTMAMMLEIHSMFVRKIKAEGIFFKTQDELTNYVQDNFETNYESLLQFLMYSNYS